MNQQLNNNKRENNNIMKCRACDILLTSFETTRKIIENGREIYPDLCTKCFIFDNDIETVENFEEYNDEFDTFDDDVEPYNGITWENYK